MKAHIDHNNQTTTLYISGNLTFSDRQDAIDLIPRLFETGGRQIVVDVSEVGYIDSAGLGVLLTLREHAGENDAGFSIRGATGTVKATFDLAGFNKLFDFS